MLKVKIKNYVQKISKNQNNCKYTATRSKWVKRIISEKTKKKKRTDEKKQDNTTLQFIQIEYMKQMQIVVYICLYLHMNMYM